MFVFGNVALLSLCGAGRNLGSGIADAAGKTREKLSDLKKALRISSLRD